MTDINKSVKTTNYTCNGNCSGCGDIFHLSKNDKAIGVSDENNIK